MPARKGLLAPQNTFLDTIATRFDGTHSNFVLGNAKITKVYPIVYCSDGFCELTSYSRAQIMQKSCACIFLYGQKTDVQHRDAISNALNQKQELKLEVILYRSTGTPFWCLLDIVPIQDEKHEVVLFLCSYKDITKQKLHEQKQQLQHQQQQQQQQQQHLLDHQDHEQLADQQQQKLRHEQSNGENHHQHPAGSEPNQQQQLQAQQEHSAIAANSSLANKLDLEHGGQPIDQQALISMEEFQLDENDQDDDLDLDDDQEGGQHSGDHDKQTASQYSRRRSRAVLYQLSGHYGGADRRSVNMKSKLKLNNRMTIPEYKTTTIEKQRFIVSHYGLGKSCWDWLILIVSFYVAIVVPYNATFKEKRRQQLLDDEDFYQQQQQQFSSNSTLYSIYSNSSSLLAAAIDDHECEIDSIDIFVEVVFLIDVILNFRTTFVNRKGEVVTRPKIICKHYVRGWFIVDACAALPFDLLCGFNLYSRSRLKIDLNLLKLIRLLRLARLLQKMDRYSQYSYIILTLLMLIFSLLAHWCACIWYVIALEEIDRHPPEWKLGWIHQLSDKLGYNVVNATDMASSYVTALYFTTSSLTSVGFGNVSANTNAEKIFSIVIMLIGALMHAVVFGNVTALIRVMYARRSNYQTRLRDLKDFFRLHQLPKDLQQRMSDYFQTTWSLNHGIETYEILKDFPEELCGDVSLHLHREVLSLPIFGSAPQGFLKSLARHIESKFCCPTEYLIHRGDALCYLYLVCNGSMEVLQDNMVVGILGKGDLVGYDVNAILTPEHTQFAGLSKSGLSSSMGLVKSSSDLKALTYCDLKCIHIGGLLEVLKLYPEFSDTFHEEIIHDLSFNLREQHEEQPDDEDEVDDEEEEDEDDDDDEDDDGGDNEDGDEHDDEDDDEEDEDDEGDDHNGQQPPPSSGRGNNGNNGHSQGLRSPPPSSGTNRQHMGRLFRSITEGGGGSNEDEAATTTATAAAADDRQISRFDNDEQEDGDDNMQCGDYDDDEDDAADQAVGEELDAKLAGKQSTNRRQQVQSKGSNDSRRSWPPERAPIGGSTAGSSVEAQHSGSAVHQPGQASDDLIGDGGARDENDDYDEDLDVDDVEEEEEEEVAAAEEDDDEVGEVSSLLNETEQLIARRRRQATRGGRVGPLGGLAGPNPRRRHDAFIRDNDEWQKFSHSYDGLTQCSVNGGSRKIDRHNLNSMSNNRPQLQTGQTQPPPRRPDATKNYCSDETILLSDNDLPQQQQQQQNRRHQQLRRAATASRANSSSHIVSSAPLSSQHSISRQLRPAIGNAAGGRPKPPLSFDLSRNTTAIVDRRRRSAGCIQKPLSLVGNQQQVDSQLAMRQQNRCHSSLTHINENEQQQTVQPTEAPAEQRTKLGGGGSASTANNGRSSQHSRRGLARLSDEQRVGQSTSEQQAANNNRVKPKQLKTNNNNNSSFKSSYSNQDLKQIDAHITASVSQLRQEFRQELGNAVELLTRLMVDRRDQENGNHRASIPPRASNLSTRSLQSIGSINNNKNGSLVRKKIHSSGQIGTSRHATIDFNSNPKPSTTMFRSISSLNFASSKNGSDRKCDPSPIDHHQLHQTSGPPAVGLVERQAIVSMVEPRLTIGAHCWPLAGSKNPSQTTTTSTRIVSCQPHEQSPSSMEQFPAARMDSTCFQTAPTGIMAPATNMSANNRLGQPVQQQQVGSGTTTMATLTVGNSDNDSGRSSSSVNSSNWPAMVRPGNQTTLADQLQESVSAQRQTGNGGGRHATMLLKRASVDEESGQLIQGTIYDQQQVGATTRNNQQFSLFQMEKDKPNDERNCGE